jgi:DNA-binding Lrp family transcriptional regulator
VALFSGICKRVLKMCCLSYLLISTEPGFEERVGEELLKYEGVVHNVRALRDDEYNIMAKVVTDTKNSLKRFIVERINRIPHIEDMRTLITRNRT